MKNAARVTNSQTSSLGSGTLIQDRWVLTAKHVIDNNNGGHASANRITVRLPGYGGTYRVSNVYSPNNGGDIALLELASAPSGVLQVPLNDVGDEQGKLSEIGGFGRYGPAGNQQGSGSFHRAQNIISSVNGWDLIMWFTNPNNPNAVDREGIGAPGDSGGTVLLDADGQWYLGGVHRAGAITDPPNDYGKRGWETRVRSFKWWIDNHVDALWRTEIEANPGDLNIDGRVDYSDIEAMLAANRKTVPNVLNKFDFFDDDVINATPGHPTSDIDPYITQGIGTRYGDSNLDKRVDQADYDTLVTFFNGEGKGRRTWTTGDTDFDDDVDGDDYFTLIDSFGFSGVPRDRNEAAPLPEDEPIAPSLLYNPLNGEVTLATGEGWFDAYQLRTHDPQHFQAELLDLVFDDGPTDVTPNQVFQLDLLATVGALSPARFSLGAILPLGLDLPGLESILGVARYSAGPNTWGDFTLVIARAPEPGVLTLALCALLLAAPASRRRAQV